MMGEQWTDWRDHDGKGVPAELKVGMIFQWDETDDGQRGTLRKGPVTKTATTGCSWDWTNRDKFTRVLRYRIRKPKALQQLIEMVETLPAQKQLEVTP